MKLMAASQSEAKAIIAANLRCEVAGEGLRIAAISECLRAVSYLCAMSSGIYEPAASVRLTGMVRQRLAPLWPDLVTEGKHSLPAVLNVLESLSELGDMVRFEGGRWLSSPAHAICASDGVAILLGGGPREALPKLVGMSAVGVGRVRIVKPADCEGWAELWNADEWIGTPTEGLRSWSARVLAESSKRLLDAPSDIGEAYAYKPRDWVRFADLPVDMEGLNLCRARTKHAFSYFIGEFKKGNLKRLSAIGSSEARRLRYHFDVEVGRPLRVRFVDAGRLVKLRLIRRLPEREARVLLLGWQVPAPKGEHPGVTFYEFPLEVVPIVRKALDGLGVHLV